MHCVIVTIIRINRLMITRSSSRKSRLFLFLSLISGAYNILFPQGNLLHSKNITGFCVPVAIDYNKATLVVIKRIYMCFIVKIEHFCLFQARYSEY